MELDRAESDAAALTLLAPLLDDAPVALALVDTGLRFVRVNAAMARLNRRSAEEHLGRTPGEVLGPEAWALLRPLLERALGGDFLDAFPARRPWWSGTLWAENYRPRRRPRS